MAKKYCTSGSDALLKRAMKEFGLSKDQGKNLFNAVKRLDSSLDDEHIKYEDFINSEAFKQKLDELYAKTITGENLTKRKAPRTKITDVRRAIKEMTGEDILDEEAENIVMRVADIENNRRASEISTAKLARLVKAFPDARRLTYLGHFMNRFFTNEITRFETNNTLRKKLSIKTHGSRLDYFNDPVVISFIKKAATNYLKKHAALDSVTEQLKSELVYAADNLDTILFLYGGELYRDEGVKIDVNGTFIATDSAADDSTRGDEDKSAGDEDSEMSKEVNPVDGMSTSQQGRSDMTRKDPEIKQLLSLVIDTDEEGKQLRDPYGYDLPQYLNVSESVNKLHALFKGLRTTEQMLAKMRDSVDVYPWLASFRKAFDTSHEGGIIEGSKILKSKKESLRILFHKSFHSELTYFRETYMSIDVDGNPIYKTVNKNITHLESKLINGVKSHFNTRSGCALFRNNMLDISMRDTRKDILDGSAMALDVIRTKLDSLYRNSAINVARAQSPSDYTFESEQAALNGITEQLFNALKTFGIDVTKPQMHAFVNSGDKLSTENIYSGISTVRSRSFVAKYKQLVLLDSLLSQLTTSFIGWRNTVRMNRNMIDDARTNPFLGKLGSSYNNIRTIPIGYNNIIHAFTQNLGDEIENSAYIAGKRRYAWNHPSTIQDIVNGVSVGTDADIKKYIEDNYCQDATWFLRSDSTRRNPKFYSELLNDAYYGRNRGILELSEKPAFNGKDYEAMSSSDYLISILLDYMSNPSYDKHESQAWYRIHIASDKPRFITLKYKRFSKHMDVSLLKNGEKNYKDHIANKAIPFFVQEITRASEVVRHAYTKYVTGKGDAYKSYDLFKPSDDINKAFSPAMRNVMQKMKDGKEITIDDVVINGKYIGNYTGAAFHLSRFLKDEIENKTEFGKEIIKRIFAGEKTDLYTITTDMMDAYREAFHSYMAVLTKNYIDRLDDLGILDPVQQLRTDPDNIENRYSGYHLGNFGNMLIEWHSQDYARENDFLSDLYTNYRSKAQQLANEYNAAYPGETRDLQSYWCERAMFEEDVEEYIYNNWLAKVEMTQLFNGDIAFLKNTPNMQKRNSQYMFAGNTPDVSAKIHGKKVLSSDNKFRSITISSGKVVSKFIDNVRTTLEQVKNTITDPDRAALMQSNIDSMLATLSEMDVTDGWALTSLTGLRKRLRSLGQWTISDTEKEDSVDADVPAMTDEAVYQRFLHNKSLPEDILHVFSQVQKPAVASFTHREREGRGIITVPVQHKNSEYALAYVGALAAQKDSQIKAIYDFLEETAREHDDNRGIDTANFNSAVKIGNEDYVVDLSGLDVEQTYKALKDAVVIDGDRLNYTPYVTSYDASNYRIVAIKPEHFKKNAQPLGTQMKLLAVCALLGDTEVTLRDGTVITGKELTQRYMAALTSKTKKSIVRFKHELGLDLSGPDRLHKLSNWLKDQMAGDQKFTAEMRRAVSIVTRKYDTKEKSKEEFYIPLDDPSLQPLIEPLIISKLRKALYRQKTNGGIVVQASSWGRSKNLAMRYKLKDIEGAEGIDGYVYSKEEFSKVRSLTGKKLDTAYNKYLEKYQGDFSHMEIAIPMPDSVKKLISDANGKILAKYINPDGSYNMQKIKEDVPASYFDAICYRIPTEAKYSIWTCKVVEFTPDWTDNAAFYPEEIVAFTGSDFDIDTDSIELMPIPGTRDYKEDTEIFELQWAVLNSIHARPEQFLPGNFSDISDESYRITLLLNGYSSEEVKKMTTEEAKDRCDEVEDLDPMDPITDEILHYQNVDAKAMIGIAAVSSIAHAANTMANTEYVNENKNVSYNFSRIIFNNPNRNRKTQSDIIEIRDDSSAKEKTILLAGEVPLDMKYDIKGNDAGYSIGKYIGASADAGKDAALYRLNITKETLPIIICMQRLRIPGKFARLFISQPVIRAVAKEAKLILNNGYPDMESAIQEIQQRLINSFEAAAGPDNVLELHLATVKYGTSYVSYSELENSLKKNPFSLRSVDEFLQQLKFLHILSVINNKARMLRNADGFTRYNSSTAMKQSTVVERIVARDKLMRLSENLAKEHPVYLLPNNSMGNTLDGMGELYPFIAANIEAEDELHEAISEIMHTYDSTFYDILDGSGLEGIDAISALYEDYKNFRMFAGPNKIVDFSDPDVFRYYTVDFAKHYEKQLEAIKEKYPNIEEESKVLSSIGLDWFATGTSREDALFYPLLYTYTMGMDKTEESAYAADWDRLYKNPDTRKLATDLAIYFLNREHGVAPSAGTPVTNIPNSIKVGIPNYTRAFTGTNKDEVNIENFIVTFYRNHANNPFIVPDVLIPDAVATSGENSMTTISFADNSDYADNVIRTLYKRIPNTAIYKPIKWVAKINGRLYILDYGQYSEHSFHMHVQETTPLGVEGHIKEYRFNSIEDATKESLLPEASVALTAEGYGTDEYKKASDSEQDYMPALIGNKPVVRLVGEGNRPLININNFAGDVMDVLDAESISDLTTVAYNITTNTKKQQKIIDDVITRVAELAATHKPKGHIVRAIKETGVSDKSANDIFAKIESILDKYNICKIKR